MRSRIIITSLYALFLVGMLPYASAIVQTIPSVTDNSIKITKNTINSFTLSDSYGSVADISLDIKTELTQNVLNPSLVSEFSIYNEPFLSEKGEFYFEMRKPAENIIGTYNIACNSQLTRSSDKITCGHIEIDFSTLRKVYSKPTITCTEKDGCDISGYSVKPQSYDLVINTLQKTASIQATMKNAYSQSFSLDDLIVFDPTYSIVNTTTYAVHSNTVYESTYNHLNISDSDIMIYIPFDVNTTIWEYDWTKNSLDLDTYYVAYPMWVDGIYGHAQNMTTNTWMQFGDIPQIRGLTYFSMSAWVKRRTATSKVLFGKQNYTVTANSIAIELYSDGYIYFAGQDAWGRIYNTSTNWLHVTLVFNGSATGNANRLKGYINGVEQTLTYSGNVSNTTPTEPDSNGFGIGLIPFDWSDGLIDEFMVFNKSLSSAEVEQIYSGTYQRFYKSGTHDINVTIAIGSNRVNVSVINLNQNGTNTNLSLALTHDGGTTAYQAMPNGTIETFSITNTTTVLWLNFTYNSDYNGFWSPILLDNITVITYNVTESSNTTPSNTTANITYSLQVNATCDICSDLPVKYKYCTNNYTLVTYHERIGCIGGNCQIFNQSDQLICENGCSENMSIYGAECNPIEFERGLNTVFLVTAAVVIIFAFFVIGVGKKGRKK